MIWDELLARRHGVGACGFLVLVTVQRIGE